MTKNRSKITTNSMKPKKQNDYKITTEGRKTPRSKMQNRCKEANRPQRPLYLLYICRVCVCLQMYQHGRDLCESLWGDAFVAVEDEPEYAGEAGEAGSEGGGGRPCGCLTLSPSDKDVMAALRAQQDDPEELDTTKAGLPQYRAPCQTKLPPQARSGRKGNYVLHKRSVMVEDVEGSGSGL